MYNALQPIHSYLAYLVLLLLIITVLNAFAGLAGGKNFVEKDRKLALFTLISVHTQFLVGLLLYFKSPLVVGFGDAMKDATLRLYALEHPLIMVLAIMLVTIGNARSKRANPSRKKFQAIAVFFTLALVLILTRIPWNAWFN